MSHCQYLENCQVWNLFQSDVKYVWINNYCKGAKQERCERKRLGEAGKPVPETLLPNGTSISQ